MESLPKRLCCWPRKIFAEAPAGPGGEAHPRGEREDESRCEGREGLGGREPARGPREAGVHPQTKSKKCGERFSRLITDY